MDRSLSLFLSLSVDPRFGLSMVAGPTWDLRTGDLSPSLSPFSVLISLLLCFVLAKCSYHILTLYSILKFAVRIGSMLKVIIKVESLLANTSLIT